jgi:hypothetical protein
MAATEMRSEVLLGTALGLIPPGTWDASLASESDFHHVKVSAQAQYKRDAVLRLFFSDPTGRIGRDRPQLEATGRNVMAALIAPDDAIAKARISALRDDALWKAMDDTGNVAAFGQLEAIKRYDLQAQHAIATDWIDITWWANAMRKVAPPLADMLATTEASAGDPTKSQTWQKKRQALADAIADVTKNTRAAFAEGWGLAVMSTLSEQKAALEMDLCADSRQEHYTFRQPTGLTGRPT